MTSIVTLIGGPAITTEVIFEVGNIHEGSLGIATSMVDMINSVGGKIAKFQYHISEEESSKDEPFRVKFSAQDSTRGAYWERVSFNQTEWRYLANYCKQLGIEFLCTPFSIKAAKFLIEEGLVSRIKIGSGDALNFPLIDYVISTNLPIIISTGLVNESELDVLVSRLKKSDYSAKTTLMHCVSEYPTPLDRSSLNQIDYLRKFGFKVGLSDHSGKIAPALYGAMMGIDLLELHVTPHPLFFGPDIKASLSFDEVGEVLGLMEDFKLLQASRFTKDELFENSRATAAIFGRAIYWARDLTVGEKISLDSLAFLKPAGIGIPAMKYEDLVGRTTSQSVIKGQLVSREDFS